MEYYQSCRFWFPNEDPNVPVQAGSYTLEKFAKCNSCRHFQGHFQDYLCLHENGRSCLLERADCFEEKA